MKRWLRFEDKYGMSDIYCAYHMYDYMHELESVYGNDKLQVGTSNPGCFLLNNNKIEAYARDGYHDCVVFFDMDPLDKDSVILSCDWLEKKVVKRDFVTYAPVVWCAETIACRCLNIEVDELLHPAKLVSRSMGSKRTKAFRDVLVKSDVRRKIDEYKAVTEYNSKALSVICDGELGYTFDETIDFIHNIENKLLLKTDTLWEQIPPSIRRRYTGSKEDLLRELGCCNTNQPR